MSCDDDGTVGQTGSESCPETGERRDDGATIVNYVTLDHFVMVRIHARQISFIKRHFRVTLLKSSLGLTLSYLESLGDKLFGMNRLCNKRRKD